MEKQAVQDWLNRYGDAWVDGDPEQIVTLFSDDASYQETPFDNAIVGREAIRQYWQEGASDTQEDVTFSSQVWSVDGNVAVAGWQAKFKRKPSGVRVELDGVFRLQFHRISGHLLCENLQEWWHRRER